VSVLGAVLPPFVILTVISAFYSAFKSNMVIQSLLHGMTAGVSAVIISVVWDMASGIVKAKDALLIVVMICAFIANYFLRINVIFIILAAAGIGTVRTVFAAKRGKAL